MRNWLSTLVLLLMVTVTGMLVAVVMTQPDLNSLPEFTPGVTEVVREDSGMRVELGTFDPTGMPPTRETFEDTPKLPNSGSTLDVTRHTKHGVFRERLVSASVERRFRADRTAIMMELSAVGDSLTDVMRDLYEHREELRRAMAQAGHDNPVLIDGEVKTGSNAGSSSTDRRDTATMKLLLIVDGVKDASALLARPEFERIGRVKRVSYAISDPQPAIDQMRQEAIAAVRAQITDQGLGDWSEAGLRMHYLQTGLQPWHASPMILISAEATVTLRAVK